jgi:hypothetical protein
VPGTVPKPVTEDGRIERLEAEVRALRRELDELRAALGEG